MSHVVLVGPMGAGKSTVGRAVAARLGCPFVDTDDLVVAEEGRSIAELFSAEGEDAFRVRERQALARACRATEPSVVSCGGGAVLDPDNRRLIAAAGCVAWLDAPAAVLAGRIGSGADRPLLAGGVASTMLEELRIARAEAYRAVADVRIDTDGRTIDQVAEAVVDACGATTGGEGAP